jgi:hypothetical protein
MNMTTRTIALCLLLAFCSSALADPPMPSPAPPLGPEKYTIHTSGTLRDIVPGLATLTHRQIWLDTSSRHGPPPAKPVDDTPVSLNFDNATLGDILLSLCTQAGVVYEVPAGFYGSQGPPITLRPGDPAADGRPTAFLDDYTLRVTRINAGQNRAATFRWGSTSPDKPAPTSQLQITIDVIPRSPDAALRFAGVQAHASAVPDAGKPIESDARMPIDYYQPTQRDPWGRAGREAAYVTLPLPDPAATVLTRLEGNLTLFSQVKVTELRIPPDSEGKTFTQDDVTATVRTWKREGDSLQIAVDAVCPPLAHDTRQSWFGRDSQRVVLLTADGRPASPSSTSQRNNDGQVKIACTFPLTPPAAPGEVTAPLVPEGLLITFIRSGSADKIVPFVIENIPLP